ncbi:DUF3070 domain-containing protein, partial [Clostridium perfringens]
QLPYSTLYPSLHQNDKRGLKISL